MRKVFKQRILKKNYWERGDPMAAKKTSKKSTAKRSVKRSTTSKSSLGFFVKNIEKFEHSIEFDIPERITCCCRFCCYC
jgi:hypothetical protein